MGKVWNSNIERRTPLQQYRPLPRGAIMKKYKKGMRSKAIRFNSRTKATSISKSVRHSVKLRDNSSCIVCGSIHDNELHHYILRSNNGLGAENNLVTLCATHHHQIHNDINTSEFLTQICKNHLDIHYPNCDDEQRKYKKYKFEE